LCLVHFVNANAARASWMFGNLCWRENEGTCMHATKAS
jgi:hypothetical protein